MKEYREKELQLEKGVHFDVQDPRLKDILSKILKDER